MSFNIETYLKSLPLDIKIINISSRNLTYLPDLSRFTKLIRLDCSYNYLIELPPLNHNLVDLVCYNNDLTELPPLNNTLKYLNCRYNKIYNENIEKYKHDYPNKLIIKTLRDFKYTYYCLKFKKYFKIWLWEKVREPKIKLKFHPSHLNALEEIDDLEDLELFLDNWINK